MQKTILYFFAILLLFSNPAQSKTEVGSSELKKAAVEKIDQIEELSFIKNWARDHGFRAWLLGGTNASYIYSVRDELQNPGTKTHLDISDIIRPTQDIDIVVDASPAQASELETRLREKYPYLQEIPAGTENGKPKLEIKPSWEVRLLRENRGEKQALLNNADTLHQHTDSFSTGLFELTTPPSTESRFRDFREWNSANPQSFEDLRQGKIHFLYSPRHGETQFAKEGRNPPLLSVIRYFNKVFRYNAEIEPKDAEIVKKLITESNPAQDLAHPYMQKRIALDGERLYLEAKNIEKARKTLDEFGLRPKLKNQNISSELAYIMDRQPLTSIPVGLGDGPTAKELGLSMVSHETNSMLAFESLTREPGGPNAFISRDTRGEVALYGDGFYVRKGNRGGTGSGLTVRYKPKDNARLGSDFFHTTGDSYRFVNKAALDLIPERISFSPLEYFKFLAENDVGQSERGRILRFKKVLNVKMNNLPPAELQSINKIVSAELDKPNPSKFLLDSWFSSHLGETDLALIEKAIKQHPKQYEFMVIDALLSRNLGEKEIAVLHEFTNGETVFKGLAQKPNLATNPNILREINRHLQAGGHDTKMVMHLLSQPQWANPEGTKFLQQLLNKEWDFSRSDFYSTVVTNVLNKTEWMDRPEWLSLMEATMKANIPSSYGSEDRVKVDELIRKKIFAKPECASNPKCIAAVEKYLDINNDFFIALDVLPSKNWSSTEGGLQILESMIRRGNSDSYLERMLSEPPWSENATLRDLCKGQPSVQKLRASVSRGTHLKGHAKLKVANPCLDGVLKTLVHP